VLKTFDYSRKVHRSLLQRELVAGVPQIGLFIVFLFGLIFVYGFEMYFMLVPIIALYIIMRVLTKKDPWLIDIVIDSVFQKDVYLP
jgi:type IV secretory pathway VirB3-like protein